MAWRIIYRERPIGVDQLFRARYPTFEAAEAMASEQMKALGWAQVYLVEERWKLELEPAKVVKREP